MASPYLQWPFQMHAEVLLVLSLTVHTCFCHISIPITIPPQRAPMSRRSADNIDDKKGPIGLIKFGTSEKDSSVLLDFGSSRTWLVSNFCPSSNGAIKILDGDQLNANRSDKVINRTVCEHHLSIGSWASEKSISFEITKHQYEHYIGSIGLGPSSPALRDIFDDLKARYPSLSRLISFYLPKHPLRNGSLTFGGWDDTRRSKPIDWFTYKPIADATHWFLANVSLEWGHFASDMIPAILDPGSPYIIGPENIVYAMLNDVGANARGKVPCSRKLSMPVFHVKVQNRKYRLSPDSIIQLHPSGCYIAIKPSYKANKWILGTAFMSNLLTIISFDHGPVQQFKSSAQPGELVSIGFARRENPSSEWYLHANFYVYSGGIVLAIAVVAFYYLYRLVRFITPLREDFPISPSRAETSSVTKSYPFPTTPPLHSADAPFGFRLRHRTSDGLEPVSSSEMNRLQSDPIRYVPVLLRDQSSEVVRSVQIPNRDLLPSDQIGRRMTSAPPATPQTDSSTAA